MPHCAEVKILRHYVLQIAIEVIALYLTMLAHVGEYFLVIDKIHVHIVEVVKKHITPVDKLVERIVLVACQTCIAIVKDKQRVNHIDRHRSAQATHKFVNRHHLGHEIHTLSVKVEFALKELATAMVGKHKTVVMNIPFCMKILCYLTQKRLH